MSEPVDVARPRSARRVLWYCIVALFAATVVFAPIRIAYENRDDGGAAGTVTLSNFMFKPGTITVAKGTTVVFDNVDVAKHTVTADDGAFDSGPISPGDHFEFVVEEPVTYHCDFHSDMQATIEVTG